MCNLCGTEEERKRGREYEKQKADEFARMAGYCRQLANGTLDPHTDAMKPVTSLAHSLLRELVNDYI